MFSNRLGKKKQEEQENSECWNYPYNKIIENSWNTTKNAGILRRLAVT